MASEPPELPPNGTDGAISKKQAKKEAAKAEKMRRQQASSSSAAASGDAPDPFAANYGDVSLVDIQSKAVSGRTWTDISALVAAMAGETVLVRGRAHTIRPVSKKIAFVVLRHSGSTVQCVLVVDKEFVSPQMVKYATALSKESIVDIEGVVSVPSDPIKSTSQQVEIQVRKLYCVDAAAPNLPFNLEDAARSEKDFAAAEAAKKAEEAAKEDPNKEKEIADAEAAKTDPNKEKEIAEAEAAEIDPNKDKETEGTASSADAEAAKKDLNKPKQLVRVGQDTRLNYRFFDLRTPANQAIFDIQCHVEDIFRRFLRAEHFRGIHTPKLVPGSSEGGAAVFKLDYMGQPACLAQSPQLYKQMAICGDFGRVFEVGHVFRAENSYTHRHLCEFVGLDVEMEIKEHYIEVMDIVDRLFVTMFDYLNENCNKELNTIKEQYPFEPLKYLRKTLQLTFQEGVEMLKEAGTEVDPFGDLNTEVERKLGRLVLEKYGTEFYILHRYPLAVRPFYTMPCFDDRRYSNSFDVFIRGEEIISGAQRIHNPELLTTRAEECGIDVKTISSYIDSFRYGAYPHGGFGVGLERVVMLFCGLNNIRKTSLFPRDPQRLVP